MQKNRTNEDRLRENAVYFAAFLIPVFLMILIYYIRDIYPFGEEMYLRSDMYHQYAPFYRELARKLSEGGSLFYSWNVGMGVNFLAYIAYYLASPFNLILGFFNNEHIIEVMSVFIILKMGLASTTFTYYLTKKFDEKKIVYAIFGIFYAMSSYYAAFSWNIMWLDCMFLLPLIVLGIERMVKENKSLLYCITLGFAIFSNYYIAIMLCIYSVLYFVYLLFTESEGKGAGWVIRKMGRFAAFSALAGGLAACLILPEYCTLMVTQSGTFDFDWKLSNYFSVFYMLGRSLFDVPAAIFEAHDPNLYCTVGVFLMIPLYWCNQKIRLREKIGKTALLALFLLSFNMNIPNYIWHGLHFPNSLPARESFIYIFLILTMCAEALRGIRQYSQKQVFGTFGGAILLVLILEQMFMENETFNYKVFYGSMLFMAIYVILIACYRKYKNKSSLIIYLLFVTVITESALNMNDTGISSTSRTYYVNDNEAIEKLAKTAKKRSDTSFFRMEKTQRRTKNDEAWHGYRGMSTFSSTSLKGVAENYTSLGFEESYNSYAYYGATPLTSSLFSVKYILSNEEREASSLEKLVGKEFTKDGSQVYLYENLYTLPLGFMVNSDMENNWDNTSNNPFAVQNEFLSAACGADEIFTKLDVEDTESGVTVTSKQSTDVYIDMLTRDKESLTATVYDKNGALVYTKTFNDMTKPYIVHVGKLNKGEQMDISAVSSEDAVDSTLGIQVYAYGFDTQKFEDAYNKLNQSPLLVTDFKDSSIKGTINAIQDGTLYTSISYEKGWKAYVDGKEVPTKALKNGMLTINLTKGTHDVSFKFVPEGFVPGVIISLISLLILALYIVFLSMKKKGMKKKAPQRRTSVVQRLREQEQIEDPREQAAKNEKIIVVAPTYDEEEESKDGTKTNGYAK